MKNRLDNYKEAEDDSEEGTEEDWEEGTEEEEEAVESILVVKVTSIGENEIEPSVLFAIFVEKTGWIKSVTQTPRALDGVASVVGTVGSVDGVFMCGIPTGSGSLACTFMQGGLTHASTALNVM